MDNLYQFNDPTPMHRNTLIPIPDQPQQGNYKQLYQQCKHNVALFMRQVEQQITHILQQHQQEKEEMQSTIHMLQLQINKQQRQARMPLSTTSIGQQHSQRCISHERQSQPYSRRQSTDRLLNEHSSHLNMPKLNSRKSSLSARNNSIIRQNQKENEFIPFPFNEFKSNPSSVSQCNKGSSIVAMRRAKKLKQMAESRMGQNVQSVSDLLKNIRQSQPIPFKLEQQRIVIRVVTPQMFGSRRSGQPLGSSKATMV